MKKPSALNENEKTFLKLFGQEKRLSKKFYLTGGTALASFYLPYRLSEDLDFFSENEIKLEALTVFLRSHKKKIGYRQFDFNTSFNRNLFLLLFPDSPLKIEFTYFPFPQIGKPKEEWGVKIDSLEDIAVNKLFTIYQKPRSRDFMDLYMIHKHFNLQIEDLLRKAKLKFDWHIDPLKLGSQFLLAKEIKDYPKLIKPLKEKDWQSFFEKEARRLGKKILK